MEVKIRQEPWVVEFLLSMQIELKLGNTDFCCIFCSVLIAMEAALDSVIPLD